MSMFVHCSAIIVIADALVEKKLASESCSNAAMVALVVDLLRL